MTRDDIRRALDIIYDRAAVTNEKIERERSRMGIHIDRLVHLPVGNDRQDGSKNLLPHDKHILRRAYDHSRRHCAEMLRIDADPDDARAFCVRVNDESRESFGSDAD